MRSDIRSNHRCRGGGTVAGAIRVAIASLWLPVHGCDTVNGGAVELSWKLRPASSALDEKFVDCDSGREFTGEVTDIVLHWIVDEADGVRSEGAQSWECEFNHGVTGFDLAEGKAQLWVTPACAGGDAMTDTYIAPAFVERNVIRGETVSLGAVELIVSVSNCRDPGASGPQGGRRPCICCTDPATCTPPRL